MSRATIEQNVRIAIRDDPGFDFVPGRVTSVPGLVLTRPYRWEPARDGDVWNLTHEPSGYLVSGGMIHMPARRWRGVLRDLAGFADWTQDKDTVCAALNGKPVRKIVSDAEQRWLADE